jgi:energy-coupling factor transporter ATP-binding protein EcfA2
MPYVRSGTTEGDLNYLKDVFVTPMQLADVFGIEPGSMRVLIGNKGAGKSALVEWLKKCAIDTKVPCVLVRPDQLVDTGTPEGTDLATLKGYYYEKLLRTVAAEIGSQIRSYLPLTGSQATLYDEAIASGSTRGDIFSRTLPLLASIAQPATKFDGAELVKKLRGNNSDTHLQKAINDHLLNKAESLFLLMIDDTDQLASPDDKVQLNKIWGLILAVRRLAMECNSVRPILTLRASVWARLSHENAGQRDQVDHIRPLSIHLQSSDQIIVEIIEKRMAKANATDRAPSLSPYGPYFNGKDVLLPESTQRRSWPDFISKSARERPRDALQLIKSMIEVALGDAHVKIGDEDAAKAMRLYSSERVDDVVNEYAMDCPSIREVIESFHSADFEMEFEQLRDHLGRAFGITSIQLRGRTIKNSDEDLILLLALLYEVGFINARIADVTKAKGFDHKNFSDDTKFVRYSNWNNLQAAHWEIHPAFRSHLINVRLAKERRR